MDLLNDFLTPVLDRLGHFMPQFVGALIILLVGWIVAKLVGAGVRRAVAALGITQKFQDGEEGFRIDEVIGRFAYYAVLFFVLVFVLNSLGYQAVLDPVKSMYATFLGALPNVIAASFIGLVGYMLARVLASLAELAGRGLEQLTERAGITGVDLSRILNIIVFVLVFVPALLAAAEKLSIEVISVPATEMLNAMLNAIPKILAAAVILSVAFIVGRFVSSLLSQLLASLGADALPARIGASRMFGDRVTFSQFVGGVVFFFIMLSASVAAVERLDLPVLSAALNQVLTFAGSIAVGLVILAVGNWLANLADRGLREAGSNLAAIARFAILGLVLAMGLRAMGLADEIVNLAFGLTLGALAVSFALAFGLGGREAAGRQLEQWMSRLSG